MSYPAPEYLTEIVSKRAVEIARRIGPRKTGRGLDSLSPVFSVGMVGIQIPEATAYMFDLNEGHEQYAMFDLAGKTIPIREPSGKISFRRATASNIGKTPIITRLSKDGRIDNGKPRWVYPSREGLQFLDKAIDMSIDEWFMSSDSEQIFDMFSKTGAKDALDILFSDRRN